MIQDTRKDPRAKVLSMTVRYKSATIDEFIEHHSYDVSRGGMFIKTPSPFPPGTLLKFEVRIADEKKVMQGVGRVVWKRDANSAAADSPSGMGVKFIKLDDDSKSVIDQLVGKRGNNEGAFDAGERTSGEASAATPAAAAPAPAAAAPVQPPADRPAPMRKGTMIGLGAVKLPDATPSPPAASGGGGFFPDAEPANLPNPEDRTVMRQAAELLKDALREAGG
ncbi:MAG TPA: TIGR02266 family protein, partial [Polyangiaceae bacterium]|nr:TIGR02266 family protein [Polyangiaceae bacterium]